MEVELRPAVNGCLMAIFALMTLGLVPVLMRMGERHFIRRMDDTGFQTRGGKRIAWSQVTDIKRVIGTMGDAQLSNEFIVRSSKGKASLMLSRCKNAEVAQAFLLARIPPATKPGD